MKKKSLFVLAAICTMLLPVHASLAYANEAEEAVSEVVVSEDETEAAAPSDQVNADVIWGEWYGAGHTGDSAYSMFGYAYILPNGIISDGTNTALYEKTDDTHFTVSGMEGLMITGEYGQLTAAEIRDYDIGDYSMFNRVPGAPRILLTVSLPDPNNPLATYSLATTSIFLKQINQDEYVKYILDGKIWKIGENTLKIVDGTIDLNDGSNTGTIEFLTRKDKVAVWFNWDGSGMVSYLVTQVTDSSVTLTNEDNEADIITLEFSGDAEPAEEVETE